MKLLVILNVQENYQLNYQILKKFEIKGVKYHMDERELIQEILNERSVR